MIKRMAFSVYNAVSPGSILLYMFRKFAFLLYLRFVIWSVGVVDSACVCINIFRLKCNNNICDHMVIPVIQISQSSKVNCCCESAVPGANLTIYYFKIF